MTSCSICTVKLINTFKSEAIFCAVSTGGAGTVDAPCLPDGSCSASNSTCTNNFCRCRAEFYGKNSQCGKVPRAFHLPQLGLFTYANWVCSFNVNPSHKTAPILHADTLDSHLQLVQTSVRLRDPDTQHLVRLVLRSVNALWEQAVEHSNKSSMDSYLIKKVTIKCCQWEYHEERKMAHHLCGFWYTSLLLHRLHLLHSRWSSLWNCLHFVSWNSRLLTQNSDVKLIGDSAFASCDKLVMNPCHEELKT